VASEHCVIIADAYGLTCRALSSPVTVDGRVLRPGAVIEIADFQLVQCGVACLVVGPSSEEWPEADTYAARLTPRARLSALMARWAPTRGRAYALIGGMLAAMVGLVGLGYAALSEGSMNSTAARLQAAAQWLRQTAPKGSELHIRQGRHGHIILAGYVTTELQLERLAASARSSPFAPGVEVYATQNMVSSMSRLARLDNILCEPRYEGGGRIACGDEAPNETAAAKLRIAAQQVPGLTALDVDAIPPKPKQKRKRKIVKKQPKPTGPLRITRKFGVIISKGKPYIIGQYLDKYYVGDTFQGFKIDYIGLDRVIFERNGKKYSFYVAEMGNGK